MTDRNQQQQAEMLELRKRVLLLMNLEPGIRAHEVAANLGIHKYTAARHMKAIREGWRPADGSWQSIGDIAKRLLEKAGGA